MPEQLISSFVLQGRRGRWPEFAGASNPLVAGCKPLYEHETNAALPVFAIVVDVLGRFLIEFRYATLRHHQLLLAATLERVLATARLATASGIRQTEIDLKSRGRK